jgi:hypothetical protein
MAEPSTGPPQIVRRQLRHSDASCGFLHNVPNRLYRHPVSPCSSYLVDPAEQSSSINGGRREPIVQFGSHPIGNRNRPNVASLANQINNGPVPFALLEMIQGQSHGFMSTELRLFNTAALACSRSGKRRMDLVLVRLLLELGFCFMTGGLRATDP